MATVNVILEILPSGIVKVSWLAMNAGDDGSVVDRLGWHIEKRQLNPENVPPPSSGPSVIFETSNDPSILPWVPFEYYRFIRPKVSSVMTVPVDVVAFLSAEALP